MRMPVEVLEAEILSLTREDRVRVLDRIVASLDNDAARDAAWDALAARRESEAAQDASTMLPLDAVLAKLGADLS